MKSALLRSIKALILDMDGVLWRGNQPLGDLPAIFRTIEDAGLGVALATNNATLSVEQYLDKLASFGVNLQPWQIINSSMALAFALSRQFPQGGPVYVIGENGLHAALQERGFTHSEEPGVLAVTVGLDRTLTYEKLRHATLLIRSGVPFYGTNPDRTFPAAEGILPGAGSILAALETATDTIPLIAGKPNRFMMDLALERLGTSREETLMVGDRLDTDIQGGQVVGCPTAVVLTGVSSLEQAQAWQPAPTLIAPSLTALLHM